MNQYKEKFTAYRKMDAQIIRKMKQDVIRYKKKFKNIHLEKIQEQNEVEFFELVLEVYTNLSLFPDSDIINKFRQLRFNTTFLKWFVPITEILTEFRRIEKSGKVKILRSPALVFIKSHLAGKIMHEIVQWAGYVTKYKNQQEVSIIYTSLIEVYNKRKTIRKKPIKHKDLYSKLMYDLVDGVQSRVTDDYRDVTEKNIRNLSNGKTEGIWLKFLIELCIYKDSSLSKRKFYICIYELLRIVIKDYQMLNENEFLDKDFKITFDTYRFRRVEQIIEKK